ncbi:MAG: IS66 family transposase [Candidatus Methylomirabilaceae bacterium]
MGASPTVAPDETGWRIGGWPGWLWVFATSAATMYLVDDARSFDAATKVLPADYDGVITRDGWAPCRRYTKAIHQSCWPTCSAEPRGSSRPRRAGTPPSPSS